MYKKATNKITKVLDEVSYTNTDSEIFWKVMVFKVRTNKETVKIRITGEEHFE